MITLTSNNIGAPVITLEARSYETHCILQGIIPIDTSKAEYASAQQLEFTMDTDLAFKNSNIASAMLVSGTGADCYGTPIKCHVDNHHTLILEKLDIYDKRNNVRIFLNLAFQSSSHPSIFKAKANDNLSLEDPAMEKDFCIKHIIYYCNAVWGYLSILLENLTLPSGKDLQVNLLYISSSVDIHFPIILSDYPDTSIMGNRCVMAHLKGNTLTVSTEGILKTERQKYAFFNLFYTIP